jgi:quinolinate synthase
VPLTYMNSTAAIKAFCGEHGGAICTSSNAPRAMRWAFDEAREDVPAEGGKVLFLPDQHLGRNTAVLSLGLDLDDCVVYDPWQPDGGLTDESCAPHASSCGRATARSTRASCPHMVDAARERLPGVRVLVHPECRHEVVAKADEVGSTGQIIRWVEEAPPGPASRSPPSSTSSSGSVRSTPTRRSSSSTTRCASAPR